MSITRSQQHGCQAYLFVLLTPVEPVAGWYSRYSLCLTSNLPKTLLFSHLPFSRHRMLAQRRHFTLLPLSARCDNAPDSNEYAVIITYYLGITLILS